MQTLEPPSRFKNIRVVQARVPRSVRTAWVSDLHLGTRAGNAAAFLDFLRTHEIGTLYVVGDLIDVWQLRRGIYWPQEHNDVIQKILRAAREGTRVVYIPGNHDEFVSRFCGVYGHISIQKDAIHTDAIVSRVIWLRGKDAGNRNAHERCIYIHGTPEEKRIGRRASFGCVRMRSKDVIALYQLAHIGTSVLITEESLTKFLPTEEPTLLSRAD